MLQFIPTYGTKFMTKKLWSVLSPKYDWNKHLDDLNINAETYQYGCFEECLQYVRQHSEAELYPKGIGLILYQMGKGNIQDDFIVKRVEKNLYKFKNEFTPRLAFGAYQGYIALSLKNLYLQEFFEREFYNHSVLDLNEALDMIEAVGKNTSLERKYLDKLLAKVVKPVLMDQYPKLIKYTPKLQFKIIQLCIQAKYFEPDFFDVVVDNLLNTRRVANLQFFLEIIQTLRQLDQSGDFPRILKDKIDNLIQRLKQQPKFSWKYNFDEMRFKTMKELKAVRENMKIQEVGKYLYYPKDALVGYEERRGLEEKLLEEEEKQMQREKDIEDMIYDEFMIQKLEERENEAFKKKKGIKDDDQSEDDELIQAAAKSKLPKMSQLLEDPTYLQNLSIEGGSEESEEENSDDERFSKAAQLKSTKQKKVFKKRKGRREIDRQNLDDDE